MIHGFSIQRNRSGQADKLPKTDKPETAAATTAAAGKTQKKTQGHNKRNTAGKNRNILTAVYLIRV